MRGTQNVVVPRMHIGLLATSVLVLISSCSSLEDPLTDDYVLPSPVKVMAVGHDFEWRFQYAGRDGNLGTSDDFSVDRVLQLPPDTDVELHVTSEDYVYTLSSAEIGVNTIAVPDLIDVARFRTPSEGMIELMVDPLCGFRLYHDDVMGRIEFKMPQKPADWFGEVMTSVQSETFVAMSQSESISPLKEGERSFR